MYKFIFKFYLVSFILIVVQGCAKDDTEMTGNIYGIVTDADNGEPIRAASVTLNPAGISVSTGSDGRYEFLNLPVQQYTVQVKKDEYKTNTKQITVVEGQSVSGDLQLTRGESKLKLSTNSLNFGASTNVLSFSIMNVGTTGAISWSISNDNDWLSISPTNGETNTGKSNDITVTLHRDKITKTTEGVITVSASGESSAIMIKVEVGDDNGNGNGNGNGNSNLSAGLLAYYTFDNENANDMTDNKLHATLINSTDFTDETASGKGKAVILNGMKEQYMNIPYNPLKGQRNYTISMWIKDFGSGVLFSACGSYIEACYPRLTANSENKFTYNSNCVWVDVAIDFTFSYSYTPLQDGKWHLITTACKLTSGSNCTVELYIDGVLVDIANSSVGYHAESTKIQIGGNIDGYYSFYNSMKVDNIRLYNRALEAKEVEEIYNQEK